MSLFRPSGTRKFFELRSHVAFRCFCLSFCIGTNAARCFGMASFYREESSSVQLLMSKLVATREGRTSILTFLFWQKFEMEDPRVPSFVDIFHGKKLVSRANCDKLCIDGKKILPCYTCFTVPSANALTVSRTTCLGAQCFPATSQAKLFRFGESLNSM